jgi:hypothetical protein
LVPFMLGLVMVYSAVRLTMKDLRFRRRARFVTATVVAVRNLQDVADHLEGSIFRGVPTFQPWPSSALMGLRTKPLRAALLPANQSRQPPTDPL